jgi:hypothetical protein
MDESKEDQVELLSSNGSASPRKSDQYSSPSPKYSGIGIYLDVEDPYDSQPERNSNKKKSKRETRFTNKPLMTITGSTDVTMDMSNTINLDMSNSPSPSKPILDTDTEPEEAHEQKGSFMYRRANSTRKDIRRSMNRKQRVVLKDGSTNVKYKNISKRRRRYISDFYTTLLDASWLYCLIIFAASFYISWLLFALVYWLIAFSHGDLREPANCFSSNWTCCINEVDGFSACFLFSLETQHTIGYGSRQTTTECPEAMFAMSVQSVIGCMLQAFMVGLVFARLSRPSNRSKTVIFSQNAVIYERNRKLCLVFRIGDLRDDNFILGTQVLSHIPFITNPSTH